MKQFVAIRRSITRDGYEHLPRPKIIQDILLIGDKQACQDLIDEMALDPKHQSTEEVHVDLLVTNYHGQITYDSKSKQKGAGSR